MKILGNRVLIQPTEPTSKLPSGIFLPETAVQKPNTGTIIAVGTSADQTWQDKLVMYSPITAIEIEGNHLIHVLDVKMIL